MHLNHNTIIHTMDHIVIKEEIEDNDDDVREHFHKDELHPHHIDLNIDCIHPQTCCSKLIHLQRKCKIQSHKDISYQIYFDLCQNPKLFDVSDTVD